MKSFKRYSIRMGLLLALAAGAAYAVYSGAAALHAQDAVLLGSLDVDKGVDSIALAPNSDIVYGIRFDNKTLYLFDLKTHTVRKKIRLEKTPNAIAVDPVSNIAYITAGESNKKGVLYKADADGHVTAVANLQDPQGLAIDHERNEAIIALEKEKQLLVISLDEVAVKKTIDLPQRPRLVALDEDANSAVVAAGNAEGEGKQNKILVVDLAAGSVVQTIGVKHDITALSVDGKQSIAVSVSEKEINVIDIKNGAILSSFRANDAEGVDINQSTHTAVITGRDGYLLYDLTSGRSVHYPLRDDTAAVAVDKFRNTALVGAKKKVMEVQLPNPIPKVTALTPKLARLGDPGFTLKVAGERFITSSKVKFSGISVDTTFKTNEELEAFIPASLITAPGTASVTVTNPEPAGGTSDPFSFTIQYPAPVLAVLSPNTIPAKSVDFTLRVTGANFMTGDAVYFNGRSLQTTYVSSFVLEAVVPSSLIQSKGMYPVVVTTPDNQSSNALYFTVTDTYPVISGFSPTEGPAGTLVTIVGSNFSKTPTTVSFNGTQAVIASLSDTEIKTTVPPGATTGPIMVKTSVNSGQSPAPFTIRLRQDFALSVNPQIAAIPAQGSASFTVSLVDKGIEPFTGLVKLSLQNGPAGITGSFNPQYVSRQRPSTLTLTSQQGNQATVTIQGNASIEGSDLTKTVVITLNPQTPGATILRGRILATKDANPIAGVTVKLGTQTAITDGGGNFTIMNPPAGDQVFILDGDTANHDGITYPSALPVAVNIAAGADNTLPAPIYLHEVKTSYFTQINPLIDTIVTDPEIPNYEMRIPAGTVITGWDGQPNTKVSVKPIPVDRLPIPSPPAGVYATEMYMYYFFKPGGGTPSQPIPVKMPNTFQASPGTRVKLWYYDESFTPDPNSNQWKTFGMGSVSSDGRNVIPDPGVGIPKFCCGASFADSPPPGNPAGPPDGGCKVGDPIDPFTGFFTFNKSDMSYPVPSKLRIDREYNSGNGTVGPFGLGSSINYNHFLQGSGSALTYILPEGGSYVLSLNADGSYTNINYPFLRGTKAYLNADGSRTLVFKNGDTYAFDTAGRLILITDRNNNLISIKRDSMGFITDFADSFGKRVFVSNTTVQIGSVIYTLISTLMDMAGRVVQYNYDGSARLNSVILPDGSTTTYSYDGAGRILSITNPRGIVEVTNQYDASGRVIQQTHADGGLFNLAYNVVGGSVTQTAVTEPNGSTTTYRLNGAGYSSEITDAFGQKTTYGRAFSTNVLNSVTDAFGRTTSYVYDSNGNTTSITDPAGNVTSSEYHPIFNMPTKKTDALGNVTTFTYDANGNTVQMTNPKSASTTIAYNAIGQPISVTDALGNTSTFEYDEFGNLVKTSDPLGNSAQREYDFIGRLINATDPKGNVTQYAYDEMNRITDITDMLNGRTHFTYDASGNRLAVKDAKDQTIMYTYNTRDKVVNMTDQLGNTETSNYDLNDNLISLTDRKGQTTNYQYDAMRRIVLASYADGSLTSYAYDAIGRLNYINDSVSGPLEYIYGNSGCAACGGAIDKIIQEITPFGSISYTYDAVGRKASMTVAGQPMVNYNYDADSRLTNINTTIGGVEQGFSNAYDAKGRRTSLVMPNSVITTYGYDNAGRLLNLEHLNPLNQILEKIGYVYDATGNRTSMDRLNVPVQLPSPATNIIYNTANQMLTFNNNNITYDSNGNITTVMTTCGTTVYNWDARNRLTGINGFNDDCTALLAAFRYDALGRRIEKKINGKTLQYIYDLQDIVQEIEGGTVSANYIRSLNIDEPLVRIKSDGTVRYYLTDALGSVIALTDETGSLKTQYIYNPFGFTTITGDSTDNPFQYTGRENDGTGLYYYRARYYNPELQRFISEDPIRLSGGINFFAYVANRPITDTDPMGLANFTCLGTASCTYYSNLCNKQKCGSNSDKYACDTKKCCEAYGNSPLANCIRGCLIAFDQRNCSNLQGSARNQCRYNAHVDCYSRCNGDIFGLTQVVALPAACQDAMNDIGGMLPWQVK